jgi:uncharacterized Zn finger protein (UPF0148 family)
MVAPVHQAGTNNNKEKKKGVEVSNSAPIRRSNNSTRGRSSSSPFHKMSHEKVLQKIEELQRKDRNGDKLSRKINMMMNL